MSSSGLVKIIFDTDPNGLGQGNPEILWAKKLPDNPGAFELNNSPFYAKGISYLDFVEAVQCDVFNTMFRYRCVLRHSKHSTYRILIEKSSTQFSNYWQTLRI